MAGEWSANTVTLRPGETDPDAAGRLTALVRLRARDEADEALLLDALGLNGRPIRTNTGGGGERLSPTQCGEGCETVQGYWRHIQRGEKTCRVSRDAYNAYKRGVGDAPAVAPAPQEGALLVFADVVLDPSAHVVTRGGREVALPLSCFRMLEALIRRPGQVLSRDQLYRAACGDGRFAGSKTVDMGVSRLRCALEAGGVSRLVHTVRGAGFVLRESAPGREG